MGLEIRIDGIDELRRVAAQIRATGDKGLGRQMSAALDKAVQPITKAIAAEAAKVAPSGYRPALTASLRHRRSQRTAAREASLRLTTTAKGQSENRDLPALEAGVLRHPVYGRSRRTKRGRKANPWATTAIRPGFYERATERVGPEVERQLLAVLDDFADRLAKG